MLTVFILAIIWSTLPPGYAQGPKTVTLNDSQDKYPLGPYLEILEDQNKTWTIEDLRSPDFEGQFRPNQANIPVLGFTTSAYWIRFRLRNATSQISDWRLEISRTNINYLDLYIPRPDETEITVKQTGNLRPFASRDLLHQHFVFDLPLQPGAEEMVYIRVESQASLAVPLTLWTANRFEQKVQGEQLGLGLLFGVLMIMVGQQVFLWIFLREKVYIYSTFFLTSTTFLIATLKGVAKQYLWPDLGFWNLFAAPVLGSLMVIAGLGFTSTFLDVKNRAPKLAQVIQVFQIILVIHLILLPVLPFRIITPLGLGIYVPAAFLVLLVGFVIWRQGYRPARYFLSAWIVFLGADIILALTYLGIFPLQDYMESGLDLGMILLVLLLSLALADQINTLRQEKETTQVDLLEQQAESLRLKDELNTTLQAWGAKLSQQVELRTRDLKIAQAQLVRQEKLNVLSQISSRIGHDLRNPLGVITNAIYYLKLVLSESPATVQDYLDLIAQRTQEVEQITTEVLNLARIRPPQPVVITVSELIDEALLHRTPPEIIKVTRDLAEMVPPVHVDRPQMVQVLMNIMSNAYQAMSQGGDLTFTASVNQNDVCLMIADTGPGMSPETVAQIFEPLFTTKAKGLGLGLTLSKSLVEVNGGVIEVESQEGAGTTFTIKLPVT